MWLMIYLRWILLKQMFIAHRQPRHRIALGVETDVHGEIIVVRCNGDGNVTVINFNFFFVKLKIIYA